MAYAEEFVELLPMAQSLECGVQVLSTSVRIRDLVVSRPDVVEYLRGIAPDKQELALLHALNVGVSEIRTRRK